MSTPPSCPENPIEGFKGLVRALGVVLTTRVMSTGFLPAIATLIKLRIGGLKDRFADLAERVAAGKYRPRPAPDEAHPRKAPATPARPPHADKLFRRRGWLAALLPEHAASWRGHLHRWFQTPEMVALMATAPKPAARLLRPLCWALNYAPPKILKAPPRRPRPKPEKPEKPPKPPRRRHEPPRPDPPGRCAALRDMPSSAQWPPGIPYRPLRRSQKRS